MNILIVSKYAVIDKYNNGAPSRLLKLAKEFKKLGHNVILITSNSRHCGKFPNSPSIYNYEIIDGVKVIWIRVLQYKKSASFKRLLSWIDFEVKLFRLGIRNIDNPHVVIISSLSIFTIFFGYYIKKRLRSLLVFEVRDIWPLTMCEEGSFPKWHPLVVLIGGVEKFAYKNADLIVGTMPRLDIHVKNILGYEKPFLCSPIGCDPKDHQNCDTILQNPFDEMFPINRFIIGYAGSLGLTNALDTFIKAIKILNNQDPKIYFVIAGDGDQKERYMKELKNCDNVTFIDRIDHKMIRFFLDNCDALYLSTKMSKVWEYGQSMNKVVDYMLAGKPIIASYSGYPSMINESGCGIFVKTHNVDDLISAIGYIKNLSPEEREEMGKKGQKWICEHRTYDKLAREYIEKIRKLLNKEG